MAVDEPLGEPMASSDTETSPRRPFWLVGLALLGLVGVLIGGAFLLDRQFRPPVGTQPVISEFAGSQMTPGPVGVAAVPVTQPTASATATATEAPSPTATTQTIVATSTPDPSAIESAIQEAYQRYLTVYRQAVMELDTSHLGEVLDGQALQWVTEEVDMLKAEGRPVKIVESDRQIKIFPRTQTEAALLDEYFSSSVYVDTTTKEPLPRTGPPTRVRQSYLLRRINGNWKIVDGTREDVQGGSS